MPDMYLAIRENNRRVVRGGTYDAVYGRTEFQVSEDEVAKAKIEMTNWLAGATISGVSLDSSGLTASESHTTTAITLTISDVDGFGWSDVLITCSDGRIRKEKLRFASPSAAYPRSDDYGWARY